jgi:hypothetical protein
VGTMTLAEARRQYREFMSRMDVAFAFGHGCTMEAGHPRFRALRAEADRLLAQIKALEVAAGGSLNPPGHRISFPFCAN